MPHVTIKCFPGRTEEQKKLYNISLELQKKVEKYGIITDAEVELPQQMDMLKKHIAKIEKSLA